MPTQFKTLEPIAVRDKVLAFTEEALLITGISMGGLIGGAIMLHDKADGMAAPGPLLHGAYTAVAIGLSVGKIAPIAISYAVGRSRLSSRLVSPLMDQLEKASTPHMHMQSRLAGMATGIAMSLTMATALNLEPFDQAKAHLTQAFVSQAQASTHTPVATVAENQDYQIVYPTGFRTVVIPPLKTPIFDKG